MNNFLSATIVLLLVLAPQNQTWPEEFYSLPLHLRERPTIIVSGTFGQGRTPCVMRPDWTHVWFKDSWFTVQKVYRGQVASKIIRINTAMLPDSRYVGKDFERDHKYLVLLHPDEENMKALKTEEGLSFQDSLHDAEIIAVVELK